MKQKKYEEVILVEYLQTLMDVWMKIHGFFQKYVNNYLLLEWDINFQRDANLSF